MKKEVIGIVLWDLEVNLWGKFNEENKRRVNDLRVLWIIEEKCKEYNWGGLLCGDLFDKGERMDEDVMELSYEKLKEVELREKEVEILCI